MEWIETDLNTQTNWVDHTLLFNDFILVKMSVLNGKVYMFSKSLDKHSDKEFSFFRLYVGREDIDIVKEEIINLFKSK